MCRVSQRHRQNRWVSGHCLQGIQTELQMLKSSPGAGKVELITAKSEVKYDSEHLGTDKTFTAKDFTQLLPQFIKKIIRRISS